ncbi:hypothetical protein A3J34_05125 [Candidatus Peribacteria bacterium RIFCSPLOWO2_02_FULL_51_10]|nr:MAG: hypothetical protein A3J34_05125 [Candidatus Peribacteria bacterium RIFCSPLOWO2_02_FULL_51_10]
MKLPKIIAVGFLLLLAACSSKSEIVYEMGLKTRSPARAMKLIQASERMMIRRLAATDVKNSLVTAVPTGFGSGKLTVKVADKKAAETVRRILEEPFPFDIRLEKTGTGKELSEYAPAGIEGIDLEWIEVVESSTGQIGVELFFTPEGRAKLEKIFKDNEGKNMGIFVRDILVS